MTATDNDWQIELVKDSADISDIANLLSVGLFGDLAIVDGTEGRKYLTGKRFARFCDARDARADAKKALKSLNGLARIRYANHRTVTLDAGVHLVRPDGKRDVAVFLTGTEIRVRSGFVMTVAREDGSTETISSEDAEVARMRQIANDPKLLEIAEIFAEEPTWQKLRVAFEKIVRLITGSRDVHDLWNQGYVERAALDNFKANVEDPRHSGNDAVHGVPYGQLKGAKMSLSEGQTFVTALLNSFLDKKRSQT